MEVALNQEIGLPERLRLTAQHDRREQNESLPRERRRRGQRPRMKLRLRSDRQESDGQSDDENLTGQASDSHGSRQPYAPKPGSQSREPWRRTHDFLKSIKSGREGS